MLHDEIRQQGIEVSCFTPSEEYVLFELSINAALRREYEDGKLSQHRWDEAAVPA